RPDAQAMRRVSMSRESYPSDLTDQQWAMLEPLIPPAKPDGHPRTTNMREVLDALLYLDPTGGQWRALPHDFPPWSTVCSIRHRLHHWDSVFFPYPLVYQKFITDSKGRSSRTFRGCSL